MTWFIREGSLVTAVAALVVLVQPDVLAVTLRAWLVVVALLAAGAVLSRAFRNVPPEPEPVSSATVRRPGEVRNMRDIEQANDFVVGVDYQLFAFLQGALREIAAQRLLVHHNVLLERDQDRARKILGDEAWQLVRPRTEGAERQRWETVTVGQLAVATDALEKV
jgi:hypothetical protein